MALEEEARKKGWKIPGESWIYRLWQEIPGIVKTAHLSGVKAYEAKYGPYVPRDYSDLEALQVLCGDHTQRKVTVVLPDGTLARPWLTGWMDVRTGLYWGWHLSLVPSSITSGYAYADGVKKYEAQPPERVEDSYASYVYTDHGKDYKSYRWDGKLIAVHEKAGEVHGCLEFLLTERRVGILDDLKIKHLLARSYNAKEKPIERFHRDLTSWEEKTFAEFCGRDPASRPEAWRRLYKRHRRFERGKTGESPFISFERYRERLAEYIDHYNGSPHERSALGGARLIPLEEYGRLYTTRYEISPEIMALLLMRAEERTIDKNGVYGVNRSQRYTHQAMSPFKGMKVEVRFSDDDYSRVWVVLPNLGICEAERLTPSLLLIPNRETLKAVAEMRAHERRVIRDFQLLAQSQLRGETTENRAIEILTADRAGKRSGRAEPGISRSDHNPTPVRFGRGSAVTGIPELVKVTEADMADVPVDWSIFRESEPIIITEFDDDE